MCFTTNMWTDNHKHRSYTTLTGHWIEDWTLHNRVLTTDEFDSTLPKTGINLKAQLEDIFEALGLDSKHLENAIFTTDKGTNIVYAWINVEYKWTLNIKEHMLYINKQMLNMNGHMLNMN